MKKIENFKKNRTFREQQKSKIKAKISNNKSRNINKKIGNFKKSKISQKREIQKNRKFQKKTKSLIEK